MKRYSVEMDVEYGRGIYDGEKYHRLEERICSTGKWVMYEDAEFLEKRIKRMQARIDRLEGRK